MKAISLIISVALLLSFSVGKANAITCDSRFVVDNGTSLTVKPTDGDLADDHINVECALEFATQEDIPIVQLIAGRYAFGERVKAYGFAGTLRGKGMWDKTIIWSEAFEFIGGSPTFEHLHIENDEYSREGILAIQDPENCGRAMFVSVNRVSMVNDSPIGFSMVTNDSCDELLRGALSINRSAFIAEELSLGLYGLTSGARVSLTNNDFRSNGTCIYSGLNQIAMSALANSCSANEGLYVEGWDHLSRSDYYLRGNIFEDRAPSIFMDFGQRLSVHLEDNWLGTTIVGDKEYSGDTVTVNAINNKLRATGDYVCLGVARATSVIAGNTCDYDNGAQIMMRDTRSSTINQPDWNLYEDGSENLNLLSNAKPYGS